jgi:glycosyltransferase involved in cell wall biosynthesis
MVDPLNVDSIAKGILQLVEDENLRKSLQENGAHRIRKFNWDQCARTTLNVLQSAVAENRQR